MTAAVAEAERPAARINIWPRGGAKSTHAELAVVYLGAAGTVDSERHRELEADPERWLYTLFPEYLGGTESPIEMAPHHREFWAWVASLRAQRAYCLYVSDTQPQADEHVATIAEMLVSERFALMYPQLANRKLTKFGHSAGWRRQRLRTAAGFTVDALGLDKAARGMKIDKDRPDVEVFDDLDQENDSPTATATKVRSLTRKIIPAQARGCVTIGVQNLVLSGGIFHQLTTGDADFLHHRTVSGPYPALEDFDPERDIERDESGAYRTPFHITGGRPTWVGQGLRECEALLEDAGVEAFMVECQHRLDLISDLVLPQFSSDVHEYRHSAMPEFVAYFGGLDFGGEGLTAHLSASTVQGMTKYGRLVLLDEWGKNGPNVAELQLTEMQEREEQYGRIRWCADGDERTAIQYLRRMGFDVVAAKHGPGSLEQRIRQFGRRLMPVGGVPGFFYCRGCERFRYEAQRWRRKAPKNPEDPGKRAVIAVDDDVLMSVLYGAERAEAEMGAVAPDAVKVVF